jgi:hypothetical protein
MTHTTHLMIWTAAWVLTVAISKFGLIPFTLLALLLNVGVGMGMIWANIRFLNGQDELMRKVQHEAMGISLGVAVVGGIALSLSNSSTLVPFEAQISHLVLLIGLTYILSLVINMRRYA